jgi:hypothetical protein
MTRTGTRARAAERAARVRTAIVHNIGFKIVAFLLALLAYAAAHRPDTLPKDPPPESR